MHTLFFRSKLLECFRITSKNLPLLAARVINFGLTNKISVKYRFRRNSLPTSLIYFVRNKYFFISQFVQSQVSTTYRFNINGFHQIQNDTLIIWNTGSVHFFLNPFHFFKKICRFIHIKNDCKHDGGKISFHST